MIFNFRFSCRADAWSHHRVGPKHTAIVCTGDRRPAPLHVLRASHHGVPPDIGGTWQAPTSQFRASSKHTQPSMMGLHMDSQVFTTRNVDTDSVWLQGWGLRHQSARTGASHTKHGKQRGPVVKLCEFVWFCFTMWCFWVLQCKQRLRTFSGGPVCRLHFAGYFPLFLRDDQHHNGEVQVAKFYLTASGTPVLVCS